MGKEESESVEQGRKLHDAALPLRHRLRESLQPQHAFAVAGRAGIEPRRILSDFRPLFEGIPLREIKKDVSQCSHLNKGESQCSTQYEEESQYSPQYFVKLQINLHIYKIL